MARAALRQMAMGLLYKYGGMKGGEIGQIIGLDYSTVSQGRKRLRESLKSEEVARTYGEDRGKVVKSKDLTQRFQRFNNVSMTLQASLGVTIWI